MRAVPIPGEILRTDVFLGLTFNELITLGSAPIVFVFPSLFIDQIPLVASLGLAVLFAVGVVGVVIQTPNGQTPLQWAPAAARRRLTPDTYYLKPRHRNRDELRHLDVVQTAAQVHAESLPDEERDDSPAANVGSVVDLSESLPDVDFPLDGDTPTADAETQGESDADADARSTAVPLTE